jgi:sigma-B regulation protein RsbU (phosphoserine phosphatase)
MRKRDFISIFYGILNYKDHSFIYSNCGHNPALHYSSTGTKLLEGGDPSLNLIKDAEFKSFEIHLDKNDQILFYTDGVVEVFSKDKQQYGLNRLINLFETNIVKSPDKMISEIISSTKSFSSSDFYNDDFTLLALKRNN